METSSAPTRRSASDQRERLLRAAARLFARKGYHGTGVAEIGRAVSLGRGGLYHHMGSKEALLVEIVSRHVVEMVAFGDEVLASSASPPEQIRMLSRRLMRAIAENLDEVTVFFRDGDHIEGRARRETLELRDRYERIWGTVLEAGVARGDFRVSGTLVVKGILGMHNYSYVWIDPAGRASPEEIADLFCDLVLRGIMIPEAAGAPDPGP